jgi:hypothetical protein
MYLHYVKRNLSETEKVYEDSVVQSYKQFLAFANHSRNERFSLYSRIHCKAFSKYAFSVYKILTVLCSFMWHWTSSRKGIKYIKGISEQNVKVNFVPKRQP